MQVDAVFFIFLAIFARQAAIYLAKIWLVRGLLSKLKFFKKRLVTEESAQPSNRSLLKNAFFSLLAASIMAMLSKLAYYELSFSSVFVILTANKIYFVFSIFLYCLLFDFWFYLAHRALHTGFLYRYVHSVHHELRETNIYGVAHFHFFEIILYGLCHLLVATFLPMHLYAIIVAVLLIELQNIFAHWGYEFFPHFWRSRFRYMMYSTDHAHHHRHLTHNYGYFSKIWDVLLKTDRKESVVNATG